MDNIQKILKIDNQVEKYIKIAILLLIVGAFVILLVLGLNKLSDAQQYYKYFGTGNTFVFEKWYFFISIVITYVGIFVIILSLYKINIGTIILCVIFIGLNIAINLKIYYFIPTIYDTSLTTVRVLSILNILAIFLFFVIVNNNSRFPILSYSFISLILIFNAYNATLGIRSST